METVASIWLIAIGLYGLFRWKPLLGDDVLAEVVTRVTSAMCLVIGTLNVM